MKVYGPRHIDALARDRDQLWAEAVDRYSAGQLWYLNGELEVSPKKENRPPV